MSSENAGHDAFVEALRLIVETEDDDDETAANQTVPLLKQAIEEGLEPGDEAEAHRDLGTIYLQNPLVQDYSASIAHFERAFDLKPGVEIPEFQTKVWLAAQDDYGILLCLEASKAEAQEDFGRAEELYVHAIGQTDHPRAHCGLGVLYIQQQQAEHFDAAVREFKHVIKSEAKYRSFKGIDETFETSREMVRTLEGGVLEQAVGGVAGAVGLVVSVVKWGIGLLGIAVVIALIYALFFD